MYRSQCSLYSFIRYKIHGLLEKVIRIQEPVEIGRRMEDGDEAALK